MTAEITIEQNDKLPADEGRGTSAWSYEAFGGRMTARLNKIRRLLGKTTETPQRADNQASRM